MTAIGKLLTGPARLAASACSTLAVVALFAMMVMTFFDVILRSTIGQPIEAATELTRLLMAVLVFSVLPVVSAKGGHITVDLLDPLFPDWLKRVSNSVISILCGVMLLWPAQRCIVLANRARDYGDVTEYLAIPTFYLTWFITIAVFFTAFALLARGIVGFFNPELVFTADNNTAPDKGVQIDD